MLYISLPAAVLSWMSRVACSLEHLDPKRIMRSSGRLSALQHNNMNTEAEWSVKATPVRGYQQKAQGLVKQARGNQLIIEIITM